MGKSYVITRFLSLTRQLLSTIETDDLYQVALLVDQMKHDDINLRVNAFKSVERIG